MQRSKAIAMDGALATAISFGPARMGFGLFLPQFKNAFNISTQQAGLIASSGFAGFFAALLLSGILVSRCGPRYAVVVGAFAAMIGMFMISVSQSPMFLTAGVVVASASAGFCWSPFNNAAQRGVEERYQGRTLSIISTGTTGGIALAGLMAFCVASTEHGWRAAWLVFSITALIAIVISTLALARLPSEPSTNYSHHDASLKRLLHHTAWPLYGIALSFGITNSIYLSFAVNQVDQAGGLSGLATSLSGPVLYMSFGAAGLFGLATAELHQRLGMPTLVAGIFLASMLSLVLIGITPASWPGMLASSALQGMCVMMLSAIFSFWSARLFPALATVSLTAVLVVFALGNILGPVLAGLFQGGMDMTGVFLVAGGLSLATAVVFPLAYRVMFNSQPR
ncbi:MFS transporter [Larsenimonas rhizosphaerae]|uniref:MFS transporter n=1 Tax=Larsenimonas rhizosphaerae TaxID=2944682 RepID=A0AA41ZJ86_9GAMM|nr:MFS transporter [Larsenimonas rhizosphaerae]MCX2522776.1 MFS transporter [Larsenimonas rhizosphaerae]